VAVAVVKDGRTESTDSIVEPWRKRIKAAQRDRSRFEPTWHAAIAFAAGKHWLKWSRKRRRLILPDLPKGRERYSVDEITQYRLTAVGELSHDDEIPELQFRQDDVESQQVAKQINEAVAYCLDEEVHANEILRDLKFKIVDLGTAAIRCRWDPTAGPVRTRVPLGPEGKPVLDEETLAALKANGQMPDGSLPKYRAMHEGRTVWELGTPFNLLVPPGIEFARDFPWEVWVRPVLIEKLIEEYGDLAEGLQEDPLAATHLLGVKELADMQGAGDPESESGQPGQLDGHVLVYTCFERPTQAKPQGEKVVLAGSEELRPLASPGPFEYVGPDRTPHTGITYFHYVPVTGRFWGRGLIEGIKDANRMIDRRRTQIGETLDRGQTKVYVEEGSLSQDPEGQPMEVVELKPGAPRPTIQPGVDPGAWMQAEVASLREDMDRASGIRAVTLGENPTNVGTYSQLQLLRESDQIKRIPIIENVQNGKARLIEDTVYDIRKYWGSAKQINIAGETEGMLQAHTFDASKVPDFFKVSIAKGAAKVTSQAAQLQMVTDLAQYSINARQPLPPSWYFESLKAGKPLPIPEPPTDDQIEKASIENLKIARGEPVQVAYYDPGLVHVPEHRKLEIQAELSGRPDIGQAVEQHIQEHLQMEQAKAQQQASQTPPGLPTPPAPPAPPAGPAAT
jgi:hypothetical protein